MRPGGENDGSDVNAMQDSKIKGAVPSSLDDALTLLPSGGGHERIQIARSLTRAIRFKILIRVYTLQLVPAILRQLPQPLRWPERFPPSGAGYSCWLSEFARMPAALRSSPVP